MSTHRFLLAAGTGLLLCMLTGCATPKPADYTNFRAHRPRSILVLPPLNESTAVEGTYGYLSTITYPLAELGYYVYPVAVVDQFLKENGLPTAGEMHQVPLDKIRDIINPDAVLYTTLVEYGSKYQVINSSTQVAVKGRLVDTKTGTLLWEGTGMAQEDSGGSGNLIADAVAAVVSQVINQSTDQAHGISRAASFNMLAIKDRGVLYGPYHPKFAEQP
jgi:hypothetical protein